VPPSVASCVYVIAIAGGQISSGQAFSLAPGLFAYPNLEADISFDLVSSHLVQQGRIDLKRQHGPCTLDPVLSAITGSSHESVHSAARLGCQGRWMIVFTPSPPCAQLRFFPQGAGTRKSLESTSLAAAGGWAYSPRVAIRVAVDCERIADAEDSPGRLGRGMPGCAAETSDGSTSPETNVRGSNPFGRKSESPSIASAFRRPIIWLAEECTLFDVQPIDLRGPCTAATPGGSRRPCSWFGAFRSCRVVPTHWGCRGSRPNR